MDSSEKGGYNCFPTPFFFQIKDDEPMDMILEQKTEVQASEFHLEHITGRDGRIMTLTAKTNKGNHIGSIANG